MLVVPPLNLNASGTCLSLFASRCHAVTRVQGTPPPLHTCPGQLYIEGYISGCTFPLSLVLLLAVKLLNNLAGRVGQCTYIAAIELLLTCDIDPCAVPPAL